MDNFPGTAGNDTFIGDATSSQASDLVSGGAGTDTLRVFDLTGANAATPATDATFETAVVTFVDLAAGEFVTVAGRTVSADLAGGGVLAANVAIAFAGGVVADSTVTGTTAGWTYGGLDTADLTFTSTIRGDVANIDNTISTNAADAATAVTTEGEAGTAAVAATNATSLPSLNSIETLELVDANAQTAYSLRAATSVTKLTLDNPTTGSSFTVNSGVAIALSNMDDSEAVTVAGSATQTSHSITVTNMGTVAGAGVTVNANGAAVTSINLESSGTVAAGTDSDIILASTGTETSVVLTGSGDLALTTAASVVTLNAGAFTGNLTYADNTPATATTITTGSGNDTVTAVAAVNYTINLGAGNDVLTTANLSITDAIDFGDGAGDVLAISEADIDSLDANTDATKAILAKVTGYEILRSTDDLDGTALVVSRFGVNTFQMAAATTADTSVSGFTSGATIEKRIETDDSANAAIVVGMTNATAAGTSSDTLNISLNANLTATQTIGAAVAGTALSAAGALVVSNFDIAGINIVNVTAADRTNADLATNRDDGYEIDLEDNAAGENSASLTTLNIAGSAAVFYTVEAGTTGLQTIDGSTATGNLYLNANAFAGIQGVVIKGGAGVNSLMGSALGDQIVGGGRADLIDGGKGADVLTGGAGADIYFFSAEATVAGDTGSPSTANLDTITDFEKGVDLIALHNDDATVASEVNVALSLVANATGAVATAVISANGIATFNAADDTLAERIIAVDAAIVAGADAAAGQSAVFEFGSDSYVFISGGTDGVTAEDTLIKLVGISGLTVATINGNGEMSIA